MKIFSWNIRQGGGTRCSEIIKNIISYNPEIIALSEFKNNKNGISIRNTLLTKGYSFQINSAAPSDENTVFMASKFPCSSLLYNERDLSYPNNIIKASFFAFDIYTVYLPHKKKHRLFELLLNEIKKDKPAIIVGDYNTGINYVDQKGDSFWYQEQLKKLEKQNYRDAFRYIHGEKEEYSWYSNQGNGYRYDHSYVHEDLTPIIKDCQYLHKWRSEQNLSDHSPMVIELNA